MLREPTLIYAAAAACFSACAVSLFQARKGISLHVEFVFSPTNNHPRRYRHIVRIIFMIPFFGSTSWLALKFREQAIYFSTPRDCYEAWVIYNFMALCFAYAGGPGGIVVKAEGKIIKILCFPRVQVDGFFLRRCKQGTLQFVILKPVLAAVSLVLFAFHKFEVGNWSRKEGFLYIAVLYNLCYMTALNSLLLFYLGTRDVLEPYKPGIKFLLIKIIVFLTFWQGIIIAIVMRVRQSLIRDKSDAEALQNFLVCFEMLGASLLMMYAFPWKPFKMGGAVGGQPWRAFLHAISVSDAVADVVHQFHPDYSTYVLYAEGDLAENVKKKVYRGGDARTSDLEIAALDASTSNARGTITDRHRRQANLLASDSDADDADDEQPSNCLLDDSSEGELECVPRLISRRGSKHLSPEGSKPLLPSGDGGSSSSHHRKHGAGT